MESEENPPNAIPATNPPKDFVPPESDQELEQELVDDGLQIAEEDIRETHDELREQKPIAQDEPIPQKSAPISSHPSKATTEKQWAERSQHPDA